jgi:asparagine synthase (glutamine-hydrolysing)
MGTWLSEDHATGLANNRLAIIDVDGGKQPIRSTDGRFVIVFNGELYNFLALRRRLEAQGHRLVTRCDTEIVMEAYSEWGHGCLQHFRGMFAIAIYDAETRELFLARDRTGIKPLYYHMGPAGFYFASEMKAILGVSDVPRCLDYRAVADLLVLGYPVLPKTFFDGIAELEPGTWLKLSARGLEKGRYWKWSRTPASLSEPAALEQSERVITESLDEQLVSDVPIGAFLSGGIDSSLLTALLVKCLGRNLEAYTVAFAEADYDESPYARVVARHLGIPHTEITLDPKTSGVSLVNEILAQFDQPFGDSSAIPTYLLCREIRKSVKVVIGGDGGDEMFGGYRRFWYADLAKRLKGVPQSWLKASGNVLSQFKVLAPEAIRGGDRFLRAAAARNGRRLVDLSCYVFVDKLTDVLRPEVSRRIQAYTTSLVPYEDGSSDVGGGEFIDATIWSTLPGDYLRKIDIVSNAHGLEVRVPFLGEQVLAWSAQVPQHLKYSGRQNKLLLRKLAAKYLPKAIAEKQKAGFGIPLDTWLGKNGRTEIQALLDSPKARIAQLIRRDYVANLLSGFAQQTPDLRVRSRFNTYQQVYCLWALELWMNRWNPTL